jgi:hypothetical protein
MFRTGEWGGRMRRALGRARWPIVSVWLTYVVAVAAGIAMVHRDVPFATDHRDRRVRIVVPTGHARMPDRRGGDVREALRDFAANATIGTLPKAVSGLAVVLAYPQVAYQGWIGGIVSRASNGPSRFGDWRGAIYYLVTVVLQVTGFALVVGGGVNAGVALLRPRAEYRGFKWLGILPVEAAKDAGWLYLAALPILLLASTWEFLSPWNVWG